MAECSQAQRAPVSLAVSLQVSSRVTAPNLLPIKCNCLNQWPR
ncbi:Uncharacterised protein [Vibrio cholerae]|nr:Uncharacterised protein [Vibrio cholerae]